MVMKEYIDPFTEEKDNRGRTALTYLRTKEFIENKGSFTKPIWIALK